MAQAAWARGWERVNQLRNESLILTWINAIALNCYRSSLRKSPQLEQLPEIPSPASINLAAIDIEQILDKSTPRDRALFRKFLQGSTTREIAEEQRVSQTAIRLRFLRARREARERLQLAA
jgi:RNA polymerase sigma factor (sigma-70 family)